MSRGEVLRQEFTPEVLLEVGYKAIYRCMEKIRTSIDRDPKQYLKVKFDEDLKKFQLKIDELAEEAAKDIIYDSFHSNVTIRGEETSLKPVTASDGICVLLDMVDGTDLLQRGLGNWCSAMVFFDPVSASILCALIGLPNDEIYFTKATSTETFIRTPTRTPDEFDIRSVHIDQESAQQQVRLRDASVAFYGQKLGAFLSLSKQPRFIKMIQELEQESTEKKKSDPRGVPRFRIYNLGGNPMMTRLIEGDINAIIDTRGQLCHDAVPGFCIALNAGATIIDLATKRPLTLELISRALTTPSNTFRYVVASQESLAYEIADLLD